MTSLKTALGSVGTDMKGVTDTISELTHKKIPFLRSPGNDKYKCFVSAQSWSWLAGEVNSLKKELGSVGKDLRGATDTISELFCFCTVLELDTVTEMTNEKILFLGFTGTD